MQIREYFSTCSFVSYYVGITSKDLKKEKTFVKRSHKNHQYRKFSNNLTYNMPLTKYNDSVASEGKFIKVFNYKTCSGCT